MGHGQHRPVRHADELRPDRRRREHNDGEVRLAYTKDQIKDAPNVDADGALSREEEQRLYEHYGRGDYDNWDGSDARVPTTTPTPATSRPAATRAGRRPTTR